LWKKLQKEPEKEAETVLSWNKYKQSIYLIWILQEEVNNGGYQQYYFNTRGQYYKYLPEALKLVGANKFAKLTQQANDIFERAKMGQNPKYTLDEYNNSDKNLLNKLDNAFYDLYNSENLEKIQVEFIRKNKSEFIEK